MSCNVLPCLCCVLLKLLNLALHCHVKLVPVTPQSSVVDRGPGPLLLQRSSTLQGKNTGRPSLRANVYTNTTAT